MEADLPGTWIAWGDPPLPAGHGRIAPSVRHTMATPEDEITAAERAEILKGAVLLPRRAAPPPGADYFASWQAWGAFSPPGFGPRARGDPAD